MPLKSFDLVRYNFPMFLVKAKSSFDLKIVISSPKHQLHQFQSCW